MSFLQRIKSLEIFSEDDFHRFVVEVSKVGFFGIVVIFFADEFCFDSFLATSEVEEENFAIFDFVIEVSGTDAGSNVFVDSSFGEDKDTVSLVEELLGVVEADIFFGFFVGYKVWVTSCEINPESIPPMDH